MKRVTATIIGIITLVQCFAQSYSNGTYSTNFGTIKFVTETGFEYPNGGIIYGDYKDNGTITGTFQNNAKEIEGSFHNGAAEGKFVFFPKGGSDFFQQINGFYGNWGYQSNNKYSTNPDHKWDGTKTSNTTPNDFTINVWSGKWNTSQGYLILQQVGNKVTGKYHTVGDITATYNPSTKKLTGTFTNNGKQGYLEYTFEGNSFKGKWGWTTALTGGDWTGTKHVKTNKAIGTTTTTNTTATTTTVTQGLSSNTTSETVRYRVSAHSIHWWALGDEQSDLYGFAGVRVYRVTNGSRTEIANFGRKDQYFFNTTEEQVYPTQNYHYYFPKTASFQRDFVFNVSDFKNPSVDIEIELWHHLRRKRVGENMDNGKIRMVYNLEELPVDKNGLVSFGQPNKMFLKLKNSNNENNQHYTCFFFRFSFFLQIKNSSAAETTLDKTIAEAAGETSTDWNGKLTELFTLEMAATVTGYAQAEAKQDYNQMLKNAATHSLAYRWEKGRSKAVKNPINNKTMDIPADDFIQLAWVRTTTLQQFKQNYHTPTAEEKANAEQAMKGKLQQMEKEGTISKGQASNAENIATGFGDGLSFTEISGIGDYAVWNNKHKQLKVFYKGLEFEITAEVSSDEAVNKQKSIEAAKLIIKQKL